MAVARQKEFTTPPGKYIEPITATQPNNIAITNEHIEKDGEVSNVSSGRICSSCSEGNNRSEWELI